MDKLVGAFSGVLKSSGAPVPPTQSAQNERQYLRLPVESARKLRWFEKADLQALTKSHFREKRELLDTIAALKKVLIRHGLEDTKLDAEVAAHIRSADEVQEEHEGVASVLLSALEPHVQELRFENERLQAAIKAAQHAAVAVAATTSSDAHMAPANGGEDAPTASGGPQALAMSAPLPRRLDSLDLAQLATRGCQTRMDPVAKRQIAILEERCEQLGKQVSELKASLAKQQAAARRRGAEGNDAARAQQLQDMLLELQEAVREEAKKAARADARATRLEGELKALQTQHRTLTKEHKELQQQLTDMQNQADAAASAAVAKAAAAAAAGEEAKAAAEAREEATALRHTLAELRAELSTAQGCITKLEADLQATQQREASAVAALAEAEAVARRSDELAAANVQLSQRLAESRAELEMAAYYKKLCGEMTSGKARMEDELLHLATLLSASEVKIADMVARVAAADEQAAVAENRARAAESSMAAEVERRCGAVLSSRALWPQQLRDEVSSLESRAAELEKSTAEAVRRADEASLTEQELREELKAKSEILATLMAEASAATTALADQMQQLRESLTESQARAAGLQDELAAERARSKAREEAAEAAAAAAAAHGGRMASSHGSAGSVQGQGGYTRQSAVAVMNGTSNSTAVMTPKWQVQNKVGSGSLYNLNVDTSAGGAAGGGPSGLGLVVGGGGGGRLPMGMGGVDAVYMKNVLFKFLEAHLCNKVQERDMLLPAVATLLQASQEEFTALQKILRATAPPSRQMLSVLGLSR